MNDYTVFLIKGKDVFDIIKLVGNLSWRDNIDTLGMELTFDLANNNEKYFPKIEIDMKEHILLKNTNGKEIFRGKIVDEGENGRFNRSYIAYDYAFYLNKSKIIKQFNKIKASEAIKQLCNTFNVPIGNIVEIKTLINKIYKDKTVAEIIKDILDQATNELKIKYRLEMRDSKLYIEKYEDLLINPKLQLFAQPDIRLTDVIGSNISRNRSIEELKNSILITSGNEESSRIIATAKDEQSIKDFGLLQEIESVEDKDIAQARNIANNKLKELNKTQEDISIELLGHDDVRAGRILNLDESITGIKGKYLIKDCTHTYKNHIHLMQLQLGVV